MGNKFDPNEIPKEKIIDWIYEHEQLSEDFEEYFRQKGKEYSVTLYPFVVVNGTIEIPNSVKTNDEIRQYIYDHMAEIKKGQPDFDYAGIDFEWWTSDGEFVHRNY